MSTDAKDAINNISRTSAGLRDALFEEFDALRRGESNPQRARSAAMLGNTILQSVQAEIEYHKYVSSNGSNSALGVLQLGTPVPLGTPAAITETPPAAEQKAA